MRQHLSYIVFILLVLSHKVLYGGDTSALGIDYEELKSGMTRDAIIASVKKMPEDTYGLWNDARFRLFFPFLSPKRTLAFTQKNKTCKDTFLIELDGNHTLKSIFRYCRNSASANAYFLWPKNGAYERFIQSIKEGDDFQTISSQLGGRRPSSYFMDMEREWVVAFDYNVRGATVKLYVSAGSGKVKSIESLVNCCIVIEIDGKRCDFDLFELPPPKKRIRPWTEPPLPAEVEVIPSQDI